MRREQSSARAQQSAGSRLNVRRLLAVGTVVALALLLATVASASNIFRDPSDGRIVHWSDGSRSQAWVTIVDHTGPNWPVYAPAIDWDNAGHINVTYYSNSCNGNDHCVGVNNFDFNQNCRDRGGNTINVWSHSGQAHMTGDTHIDLNQRCADNVGEQYTDSNRKVITCHEEGHAIGSLANAVNASYRDTCMAATGGNFDQSDASRTGQQHDFVMLDDEIYDHND
jgi:hypothetical protein